MFHDHFYYTGTEIYIARVTDASDVLEDLSVFDIPSSCFSTDSRRANHKRQLEEIDETAFLL